MYRNTVWWWAAEPAAYEGRLLEYRNGQTLFGDCTAPTAPSHGDAVSLRLSDDRHYTLIWPGGTIPIQRHVFDNATSGWAVNGRARLVLPGAA